MSEANGSHVGGARERHAVLRARVVALVEEHCVWRVARLCCAEQRRIEAGVRVEAARVGDRCGTPVHLCYAPLQHHMRNLHTIILWLILALIQNVRSLGQTNRTNPTQN